ncbi:MFS transporter [Francisellaceae bacterium]|nr:MFS transporter [Francisellaceae bacterium]
MNIIKWLGAELFFVISIFVTILFGMKSPEFAHINHLSSFQVSILSGSFFICFAISQFFTGALIMRRPKFYLCSVSIISAICLIIFSITSNFYLLVIARCFLGLCFGFTLINVFYVIQTFFPREHFSLWTSISLLIPNLFSAAIAMFFNSEISSIAYSALFSSFAFALLINGIFFYFTIDRTKSSNLPNKVFMFADSLSLLKNRGFWIGLIFFMGLFTGIISFSDLFNISYQIDVFSRSNSSAIQINAFIPLGVGIGGLVAGILINYIPTRYLALLFSSIALVSLYMILLTRFPINSANEFAMCFNFLFGFGCGASMLAFQQTQNVIEDIPSRLVANSIILSLTYIANGLVLQPLITDIISTTYAKPGLILFGNYYNFFNHTTTNWHKYQSGLDILLVLVFLSFVSGFLFKQPRLKQ